jgi:hypothetical protein
MPGTSGDAMSAVRHGRCPTGASVRTPDAGTLGCAGGWLDQSRIPFGFEAGQNTPVPSTKREQIHTARLGSTHQDDLHGDVPRPRKGAGAVLEPSVAPPFTTQNPLVRILGPLVRLG